MLETMIKTMLASFIIGFFLITCLKLIDQSAINAFNSAFHAKAINDIDNTLFEDPGVEGFRIVIGEGSTVTCKPIIINNKAGRACIAS